jgi:uncharacterized Zn finger protein
MFPKRFWRSVIRESREWRVRCLTCGTSRSYWKLGGIRWKAASSGKRMLVRCPQCGRSRVAAVERVIDDRRVASS